MAPRLRCRAPRAAGRHQRRARRCCATGSRSTGSRFSYPGTDRRALDEVSCDIPAGSVVAIVGEYGSGKTTLVKLLCKFYRPDSGRILVDGADLAELDTDGVAGPVQRGVPGLRPVPHPLRRDRRTRRPAAPGRPGPDPHRGARGRRRTAGRPAARRPRHPAGPQVRRCRALRGTVAEDRPGPRVDAHRAAAVRPRRADRLAGRAQRTRHLRAVHDPGPGPGGPHRRDHGDRLAPVLHRHRRRPDPGAGQGPAGRVGHPSTSCWPRPGGTPSCTPSRPTPTRRPRPCFRRGSASR